MVHEGLSRDLWQAANLITGFACMHTIAFTYACAQVDFGDSINHFWIKLIVAAHIVLLTIAECCGIWWCARKHISLECPDRPAAARADDELDSDAKARSIVRRAAQGRVLLVMFLLLPSLLVLYSRQLGGLSFNP